MSNWHPNDWRAIANFSSTNKTRSNQKKMELVTRPCYLQNLSISIDRWLVPPKPKKPHTLWQALQARAIPSQFTVPYIRNNAQFIIFSILVAVVNIGLFVARCVEFKDFKQWDGVNTNYWVILARASGKEYKLFQVAEQFWVPLTEQSSEYKMMHWHTNDWYAMFNAIAFLQDNVSISPACSYWFWCCATVLQNCDSLVWPEILSWIDTYIFTKSQAV